MHILSTIFWAVLVLGFLIFIHEFGHYIFARIFKVKINEFSLGMGPRLVWFDSKKTGIKYSLAMFPLGGFVSMEGESEESDDPNSFDKKPAWQRLIISLAGPATNLLIGFICMVILTAFVKIGSTTVTAFPERAEEIVSSEETGLSVGDKIIRLNGKKVKYLDDLSYEIMRFGNEPCDLVVVRNGEEIEIKNVVFPTGESSAQIFGIRDFNVSEIDKDLLTFIDYSVRKTVLLVRMCIESLIDLIRGRFSFEAVSGPVGISEAIGEAARTDILSLVYLMGFISINLGIMNLLPIPALDGGRSFVLCAEIITKKRIPPKIENTINAVALIILLGFSFLVMFKDIFKIIGR